MNRAKCAAGGIMPNNRTTELDADLFMRGFAAALVTMGAYEIFPYHECDVRGFGKIYEFLSEQSEAARSDEVWRHQLVLLRVMASPGIIGGFDDFVSHLSRLRHSSAELPDHLTVRLVAPRMHAEATLRALGDHHRAIVLGAAQAFISGRGY